MEVTVFYVKKDLEVSYISTGHTKNGRDYGNQKIIAIEDYNIINYKNEYRELLEFAVDIWKAQGNKEDISVMGDCVIASKTMNINSLKVNRHNNTYTDHSIIIVDVN